MKILCVYLNINWMVWQPESIKAVYVVLLLRVPDLFLPKIQGCWVYETLVIDVDYSNEQTSQSAVIWLGIVSQIICQPHLGKRLIVSMVKTLMTLLRWFLIHLKQKDRLLVPQLSILIKSWSIYVFETLRRFIFRV